MSSDTPVTVVPPSGVEPPCVLQLPTGSVFPASDGSFTVESRHLPALIANGWRVVVASGTTHVP